MPKVIVGEGKVDMALAELKRKTLDLGTLKAAASKMFYEKPSNKRKRKQNERVRRAQAMQHEEQDRFVRYY